eukprot:TCONS_00066127-protein
MTNTPCPGFHAPPALSVFTSVVSAVLCILTVIGNLLVCLAVLKDPQRKLRTPFMFIIVNLAITDLIVGIVTLPISVVTHALEAVDKKTNDYVTVSRMFYFVTVTASTFNLIAFCIDRFVAVSNPIKYRQIMRFKICVFLVALIWLLSIGIACIYLAVGYIDFIIFFAQISMALVLVMCAITVRLLCMLNLKAKKRRKLTSSHSRLQNERVTVLFLTFLITFLLCNTPAIVMMYLIKFYTTMDCTVRHVIRDLSFLFVVSNSALNPLFCTIRLKPFNQAIKIIFNYKAEGIESPLYGRNGSSHRRSDAMRRKSSEKSILLEKKKLQKSSTLKA